VTRSHTGTKRILVVEDDAAIREGLVEVLRAEGHVVVEAANGLAALEKLRWGMRPCLILLDLRMGVMTGWEFRAEQKKNSALADIPVVAMTTGRWKADDLKDFVEHIQKPIDLEALRLIVARYCPKVAPS
jgi:CheY-like chemotaxis protein